MNTKLTVSIDRNVIVQAKKSLQTKDKSLSSLIEDYFRLLIATKTKSLPTTPIVKELTGIAQTPPNTNKDDIITEYLLEKYS